MLVRWGWVSNVANGRRDKNGRPESFSGGGDIMVRKMGQAVSTKGSIETRQKAPLPGNGRAEVEENKAWGQDKRKSRGKRPVCATTHPHAHYLHLHHGEYV